jgi:hypothetical protein
MGDTCNPLAGKINYENEFRRFRTVDFAEGQDTFRLVPDTFDRKFELLFEVYLQAQTPFRCWKTLDTFHCRQFGITLKDWNEDGFEDISNDYKWWKEISFYNPTTHTFVNKVEIGTSVDSLPHQMKYDWKSDRMSDSVESRLFRFENYDIKIYARLNIISPHKLNAMIPEVIQLYQVQEGNESLVQQWLPREFPAFMGNNGSFDFFDTDKFIENYWKKNWKKWVSLPPKKLR